MPRNVGITANEKGNVSAKNGAHMWVYCKNFATIIYILFHRRLTHIANYVQLSSAKREIAYRKILTCKIDTPIFLLHYGWIDPIENVTTSENLIIHIVIHYATKYLSGFFRSTMTGTLASCSFGILCTIDSNGILKRFKQLIQQIRLIDPNNNYK